MDKQTKVEADITIKAMTKTEPAEVVSDSEQLSTEQALVELETASTAGESPDLWNHWATMKYAEGNKAEAEKGYHRCLQLEPGHRQASVNLGILLLTEGRLEDAACYLKPHLLSEGERATVQRLRLECEQKRRMSNLESTVEYLLIQNLNTHTSRLTGDASNEALTALFMKFLIAVAPAYVLDIGANDGCAARVIKKIQPACEVWAFEANPQIHRKFSPLFAGSGANYVNLALSDKTGPIKFYAPRTLSRAVVDGEIIERQAVEPADTGKTSMYKRTENSTYHEFTVEAVRLDDFIALRNIPLGSRTMALWIDVEGAAFEVLSGATASLAAVSLIIIESENYPFWKDQKQSADVARLLIAAGFVPVDRDREYGDKQFNTVFLHHSFLNLLYPASYVLEKAPTHLAGLPLRATQATAPVVPTYHKQANQPAESHGRAVETYPITGKSNSGAGFVASDHSNCSTWNNLPSTPDCSTWNNLPPMQPADKISLQRLPHSMPATTRSYSSIAAHAASQMPIFVPVFDNPTYARMMLKQLKELGLPNVSLVDNKSTYPPMLQFLDEAEQTTTVIRTGNNLGPRETILEAIGSDCVPDIFCVTDPDLEFNPQLPGNFLAELASLTKHYKLGKAGFALRLDDAHRMHQRKFTIIGKEWHVTEWEQQFWKEPMEQLRDGSPVFRAIIDTTFAVYNKRYFTPNAFYLAVRVAGNYTCRHLPWYQSSLLPPEEESYYRSSQKYSLHMGGVADTTASGSVKSTAIKN